jgi:hypothetical protein
MLAILGIVALIVFPIQVYRTAKGTGRNAALWTVLTVVVGVGFQFVLPFFVGLIMAIAMIAGGTPPEQVAVDSQGLYLMIGIVSLALSLGGMYLIARHVGKVPDDPPSVAGPQPPAPPTF